MNEHRLLSQMALKEDEEQSLRPQTLTQYIGQDGIKEMLDVYIQAAKKEMKHLIICCYMVLLD